MDVIDLDRPPAERRPPARSRPRMLVAAGLVLVLGVVLGTVGTRWWDRWQQTRAQASTISVLLLADTGPQANDAGVGTVVVNDTVVDASLVRRVTLVNAGPLPVDVHDLRVDRPGLTLRGVDKQRWIRHGETVQADADIRIVCAHGLPIKKLRVHLHVRTYDEQEHTAVAVLDATQWNDQASTACALL